VVIYAITLCLLGCSAGTFKPSVGNASCQPCPAMMNSDYGASFCSCDRGYELRGAMCTGNVKTDGSESQGQETVWSKCCKM